MKVVVRVYPWRFYYRFMEKKSLHDLLKIQQPDKEMITYTCIEDVDGTQMVSTSMNGLTLMQTVMVATTIHDSYQLQPNAKEVQILITGKVVYGTIID